MEENISNIKKRQVKELENNPDGLAQDIRELTIESERIKDHQILAKMKERLRENYYDIKDILRKYIDMDESYYSMIPIWIIGTYFHHEFNSYPYLFFNAMRGSAKTRTLKLVMKLSKDGVMMASPTEAVLFRIKGALGIDEFEGVANKDKSSIRELLNASYKKGVKIFRMKKTKSKTGEEQTVEEFEPYRAIAMANIWGMEEVLVDRCVVITLEKSNDILRTKLTEDYDTHESFAKVIERFSLCSLCSLCSEKNLYQNWNDYVIDKHNTTHTTLHTYNTYTTQTTPQVLNDIKLMKLFNKIDDSKIQGRNLELFLPLFFIADVIGDDVLNEMIKIAKEFSEKKAHEEETESRDVMVYDFISKLIDVPMKFHSIKRIALDFKDYTGEDYEWLNARWLGRALKRLNLIIEKKRVSGGIEAILNIPKAIEKLKMFKKSD